MATLIPAIEPIYWFIKRSSRQGLTRLGEITAVSQGAEHIAAEGAQAFVDAIAKDADVSLPDLPSKGTALEADELYQYGSDAVLVRQTHQRTEDDPATKSDLFTVSGV